MAKGPLPDMLTRLSDYISEHKVASSDELRFKIGEEVEGLGEEERRRLEEQLGGDLAEEVFNSITEGTRISIFSPDLHVKLNYLGELFHCPPSHRYMAEELHKAFLRLVELRSPQVLAAAREILSEFVKKAGYEATWAESNLPGVQQEVHITRGEYSLRLYLLPSVVLLPDCLGELEPT